eukprot:1139338-Pelagomonas_calceolata.AAC.3
MAEPFPCGCGSSCCLGTISVIKALHGMYTPPRKEEGRVEIQDILGQAGNMNPINQKNGISGRMRISLRVFSVAAQCCHSGRMRISTEGDQCCHTPKTMCLAYNCLDISTEFIFPCNVIDPGPTQWLHEHKCGVRLWKFKLWTVEVVSVRRILRRTLLPPASAALCRESTLCSCNLHNALPKACGGIVSLAASDLHG